MYLYWSITNKNYAKILYFETFIDFKDSILGKLMYIIIIPLILTEWVKESG
jgi:hypothetical protein